MEDFYKKLVYLSYTSMLIILCFISFLTHLGLGYFYTKNKTWSFSIKEMIIMLLIVSFLIQTTLIIENFWGVIENLGGVIFKGSFSSINPLEKDFIMDNGENFRDVALMSYLLIISGFFGLNHGVKISNMRKKIVLNAFLNSTKRIPLQRSFLIISNIVGIGIAFMSVSGVFIAAASSMGMLNDTDMLMLLSVILFSLLGAISSFCAWIYYDKKTASISRLGFIFSLLPYTLPVLTWAIYLIFDTYV